MIEYKVLRTEELPDEYPDKEWAYDYDDHLVKFENDQYVEVVYSDTGTIDCPEDMYLSRALSSLVEEIQKLAEERNELKFRLDSLDK